eukprot:185967-Chlamydomonas_euryale.AAC.1
MGDGRCSGAPPRRLVCLRQPAAASCCLTHLCNLAESQCPAPASLSPSSDLLRLFEVTPCARDSDLHCGAFCNGWCAGLQRVAWRLRRLRAATCCKGGEGPPAGSAVAGVTLHTYPYRLHTHPGQSCVSIRLAELTVRSDTARSAPRAQPFLQTVASQSSARAGTHVPAPPPCLPCCGVPLARRQPKVQRSSGCARRGPACSRHGGCRQCDDGAPAPEARCCVGGAEPLQRGKELLFSYSALLLFPVPAPRGSGASVLVRLVLKAPHAESTNGASACLDDALRGLRGGAGAPEASCWMRRQRRHGRFAALPRREWRCPKLPRWARLCLPFLLPRSLVAPQRAPARCAYWLPVRSTSTATKKHARQPLARTPRAPASR